MTLHLRPYQSEAIRRLRAALQSGYKRPVLQIPTGGGKTLVASEIISMALEKRNRVIFTAPRIELIDQTAKAFYDHGIRDIGVLQGNHPMTDPSRAVQIASVQTLARRQIPPASLVIIDEAHLMFDFVTNWMGQDDWASVPFIGLSATPWANGMARLYDQLIISATTRQMIDAGYLSKFVTYAPAHPDLANVKTIAGDYHEGQLSDAMQTGTLVADVVTTWIDLAHDLPTLVFAVDRAHARSIQEAFQAAGIGCGYVDGLTPKDERVAVRAAFHRGEIKVVSSIGVLTTGVDWDVRCIILARPTKSEQLFVQMIGRGLRPVFPAGFDQNASTAEQRLEAQAAGPKPKCIILDHSDTSLRLGQVSDIHHMHLKGNKLDEAGKRQEERQTPLPKECPSCHFLKPARVRKCSACGFEPAVQSEIQHAEGELVEINSRRSKKEEMAWSEKTLFMGELMAYAAERGYKAGWAAMKYREKTGVWPNDPRVKYATPANEISARTRSWIRSRAIAFAKSRRA